MSYKVLYRKYRPDSFVGLVGQDPIIRILKNSIINNQISHAYLFSGPRGTGKTSTARILAKTVNCLNNENGVPCEKCNNCSCFETNPDIIEIDAASNNGVDEIRELINNVKLMPTNSKYKVYIIDEVHMLSQSAFNALLLTLEEPPEHVIFILATTNIESVPITILSRCQKFEFSKISEEILFNQLEYICNKENIKYTKEGLMELANLADGGMRDALSMLDQLSKEDKEINETLVASEIGSISLNTLNVIIDSLEENDESKIISAMDELKKTNINYKIVIKKLIALLAQKAVDILKNGEKRLKYSDIKNIIFELNDCINKINININPYILIELILLNYIDKNSKKVSVATEIPIKKEIEKKPIFKEKNNEKNNLFIETRINNCFADANKKELENIKISWEIFIDKKSSKKVKGLVLDTFPVAASKEYVIFSTNIAHGVDDLINNLTLIEDNYNNKNNSSYKFVFITNDEWQKEKENYVKKIKNGEKYVKIEETALVFEKDDNHLEEIANNLFENSKIEIKGE